MRESDELWSFVGRKPEAFDTSLIKAFVAGKRILITGGAGFIGSAVARALSEYSVEHLLLLDVAESGLHEVSLDLDRNCAVAHDEIVGDVCDPALLADIFLRHHPQIVLHAAACKHVPLMERNPFAAAKTNVLGTWQIVQAANRYGAEELILVSTDKAVAPASIMGATKRISELIVLANGSATRIKAVRLGNVWGSTGSVVPVLQRQIAYGGPVTITDAGCTRHFLSIEETVQRLLGVLLFEHASTIFVSQADHSFRILDLANFLLGRAGVSRSTVELRFVGLHPGEKISERMTGDEEEVSIKAAYGLQRVLYSPRPSEPLLTAAIGEIEAAVHARDLSRLLQAVLSVVPAYVPSEYLRRQTCSSVGATSTV
jgi:FlaA1/EpsC-like NDP-sugar epimerase